MGVATFAQSGTWTVPAGVTYAVAHVLGGGGGVRPSAGWTGGGPTGDMHGGNSFVRFASANVVSLGGNAYVNGVTNGSGVGVAFDGLDAFNSPQAGAGRGGRGAEVDSATGASVALAAFGAEWVVGGAAVTPGESVGVTVGSGGNAGGGAGRVWIEYGSDTY